MEDNRNGLQRNKWLILRRITQLSIQLLFLLGPWFGIWWMKGNLAASEFLGTVPLSDPFVFAQLIASGFWPSSSLIIGFLLVVTLYAIVGGRVYCSWVCPVNIVTDTARWLRRKLGIRKSTSVPKNTRYWLLFMILLMTAASGSLIWELVNPVTMVTRGLVFGMGTAWYLLIAIFFYDLLISKNGWCGQLCPMGAAYALIGKVSLLKVDAINRIDCDDCMDCYHVCPEPQVLKPVLLGNAASSIIKPSECNNCGRCIDICSKKVFKFSNKLTN
ncbi:MAG: quinol dehydrogenase ferredoxin subunit NapH [Gammaproteobacteria bacterium]|nr:MAG: quinol dehydrogenase ferredoxin subunit NapH [Gammaproteobacteria bacterium]